uniref:Uncharacterized protein n=1 Tax=Oryza brachyantha TaxID=4533 RepID=J3MYN4_ORYBR
CSAAQSIRNHKETRNSPYGLILYVTSLGIRREQYTPLPHVHCNRLAIQIHVSVAYLYLTRLLS